MNLIVLNKSKFDEALKNIRKLSKKAHEQVLIPKVDNTGGMFGWFEHTVTGKEMNSLANSVQMQFISNNNTISTLFDELDHVYKALDSLDKDYIYSILLAVEAAEKASEQAKEASIDAKIGAEAAEKNTMDIKRTITVLKKFKSEIEELKHLTQIDEVWMATQAIQVDIEKLKLFQSRLDEVGYLTRVDELWENNKLLYNRINILESKAQLMSSYYYESNLISRFQIKQLNKRLKISYIVSGTSLFLAIAAITLSYVNLY